MRVRPRSRSLNPDVFKALIRLDTAAKKGVDQTLVELVKIRASQINHCAFCIDMHTKDALAHGESVDRIVQLSAWGESQHFYTAKEMAALELTEAITVLTDGFVPDGVWMAGRERGVTARTHVPQKESSRAGRATAGALRCVPSRAPPGSCRRRAGRTPVDPW